MRCEFGFYFVLFSLNYQVQVVFGLTTKSPEILGNSNGVADNTNELNLTINENSCSAGESHIIIDSFSSCCAGNVTLTHGIDISKYWKVCAVPVKKAKANDKPESYINSTRRVFSCILSKYLSTETVNLPSFANLMAANYPPDIKFRILKDVKTKNSAKAIQLKDYEGVRKIRIQYFDIQRNACASVVADRSVKTSGSEKSSDSVSTTTSNNASGNCDQSDEADIIGGSCCRNKSVPIDLDFWRSRPLKHHLCNETLAQEFKKWNIQEADLDAAFEICTDACNLKEEGVISFTDLTNGRILNQLSQKDITDAIKKIVPTYLSIEMTNMIVKYSESHFNITNVETEIAKHNHLAKSKTATFRPCIFYHRAVDIIFDALHLLPKLKSTTWNSAKNVCKINFYYFKCLNPYKPVLFSSCFWKKLLHTAIQNGCLNALPSNPVCRIYHAYTKKLIAYLLSSLALQNQTSLFY